MKETTLNNIKIGNIYIVKHINCSKPLKTHFLNLGIIEGTTISSVFKSPFSNPIAYNIRNKIIALRNEDTKNIIVIPKL